MTIYCALLLKLPGELGDGKIGTISWEGTYGNEVLRTSADYLPAMPRSPQIKMAQWPKSTFEPSVY